MSKEKISLLKELTESSGVCGYEQDVREILKKHLKGHAEVEQDRMGSIIFKKKGTSENPKIMIPAHMDEVGFMVNFITDEGFLRVVPLGYWPDQVLLAQKVVIKSSKDDVIGVIGSKSLFSLTEEEEKKVILKKDIFIDVGASSKKEVEEDFGIKPGDPIIPVSEFTEMKNKKYLLAKAWDDRVGCALLIDIIKELNEIKHPNTVYGVGTVQEEVGRRGGVTSTWVVNPDVGIVAEPGIANDVPEVRPDEVIARLGQGPEITVIDEKMIPNTKLRDLMVNIAKKKNIPIQFQSLIVGKTDGSRMQLHARGVPCIYMGVPTRYVHSHAGIINIDDYENTLKLIVETIKVLDEKTVKSLIP